MGVSTPTTPTVAESQAALTALGWRWATQYILDGPQDDQGDWVGDVQMGEALVAYSGTRPGKDRYVAAFADVRDGPGLLDATHWANVVAAVRTAQAELETT